MELTEVERDVLRETKCFAPTISSGPELADFLDQSVRDAADLHTEALREVFAIAENDFECPFKPFLFDSCDLSLADVQRFAPDGRYSARVNVSFEGLGVIIAPSQERLLHDGSVSLNQLTSTQVWMGLHSLRAALMQ